MNRFEHAGVRYVVLYRNLLERGEGAWETDVLETFQSKKPEHVVKLNGLEYAWIYRK